MKHEVRGGLPAEIREDGEGVKVAGYAAVFNEDADIGGMFIERIAPGAFANVLQDDVVFNINHEGLPLARSRGGEGTLILKQDDRGLYMESTLLASDPDVQRIVPKIKRGDLDKMSFAFRVKTQTWDEGQDPPIRTITEIAELVDVSVVTTPAYAGTDIGLRSLEAHRESRKKANFNAVRRRKALRIKHLDRAGQEKG